MARPLVTARWLGRIGYRRALALQDDCTRAHLRGDTLNSLLLLEHYPVFTVGLRRRWQRSAGAHDEYDDVEASRLRALGAEFIRTDRGGLITFHGPGQLVAYPMLDLASWRRSGSAVRWYVGQLERVLVETCKRFGVVADAGTTGLGQTGVWVGAERKIAAIGIHVTQRRFTSHGVALNCSSEPLGWFAQVVPCGIVDKTVTSLAVEARQPMLDCGQVWPVFVEAFASVFGCDVERE